MRGFPHTWEEPGLDDAEKELLASQSLDDVLKLTQTPGWERLVDALNQQVNDSLKDLARSSHEDEQNRGLIRALTHVLSMPDQLVRAASAELDKHR